MRLSLLTIHPPLFGGFVSEGLLGKATQKNLLSWDLVNIRDFSEPPHHRVDDKPYGGGPGMILQCDPIVKALRSVQQPTNSRTILLSAKGKAFDQSAAKRLSSYDQLIFICGRYEGVDERIAEYYVDEELRIGDYVLMGGEIAAMVIIEAVTRFIPGVLGNPLSTEDESFSIGGEQEYAHYTRPRNYEGHEVPEVLVHGDHKKINEWRMSAKNKLKD